MQAMTVYGDSRSGNCLKVKWTADRLGLPYRWVEVDVTGGLTRSARFLAINPAGQVPTVILPSGRPLAQSNAIILRLAEGSALIPADAYDRARMMEWMFWEQNSHEVYIAVARFQRVFQKRTAREVDPMLIERGYQALARMEKAAKGSSFLVGDKLTLADIALVAYTRWAHEGGFDLALYPGVKAWVGRVEWELGLV